VGHVSTAEVDEILEYACFQEGNLVSYKQKPEAAGLQDIPPQKKVVYSENAEKN